MDKPDPIKEPTKDKPSSERLSNAKTTTKPADVLGPTDRWWVRAGLIVASVGVAFLLGEGALRLLYSSNEVPTYISGDETLERSWFVPHPHLVYTFKPNHRFVMAAYGRPTVTTNRFGFRSSLDLDVVEMQKSGDVVRVVTFGGSTTMGVNDDDEIWPYLTGKLLQDSLPGRRIEVLNEGIMGYTSLDNLLDYTLRVRHFHGDVFIIYLGVNDFLAAAPARIYRADNSHFRVTLYENLNYSPIEMIPGPVRNLYTFRLLGRVMGFPDRRALLANTGTSAFRRKGWTYTSDEEKRQARIAVNEHTLNNVRDLIGAIRSHNPAATVLLSTFFHMDNPPEIKGLNRGFRALAFQEKVLFADPNTAIPHTPEMSYDYGHFRPAGDAAIADVFANALRSTLVAQYGHNPPSSASATANHPQP